MSFVAPFVGLALLGIALLIVAYVSERVPMPYSAANLLRIAFIVQGTGLLLLALTLHSMATTLRNVANSYREFIRLLKEKQRPR